MAASEPAEAELWDRYVQHGDVMARDHLVRLYAPWAASVGRRVHRRVWAYSVDCEDFVQNAHVGLLEAMSRYDPSRGVAFQAFATTRVRGAVFNGLKAILADRPRAGDEAHLKSRLANLQRASRGEGSDAFRSVVGSILDLGVGLLLDEIAASTHGSRPGSDGYSYASTKQIEEQLQLAVDKLPDRLRKIIRAHYFEHIPFRDIADSMRVTRGRVSQLHHNALERIRAFARDLG